MIYEVQQVNGGYASGIEEIEASHPAEAAGKFYREAGLMLGGGIQYPGDPMVAKRGVYRLGRLIVEVKITQAAASNKGGITINTP